MLEPIVTPHGVLRTRPEASTDDAFLFALFESVKGPVIAAMPVDDALKRRLLDMQFRAMTRGYRSAFPAARYDIVLLADQAIGRLIVNLEGGCARIVYVALLPEWRNRGIAMELMTAVLSEPRRLGMVCEASVAHDNAASLRLWRKLGFEEREHMATDVVVQWRPA